MNINFHIERLILDGVPIMSDQSDSLQAAVETELTRLVADKRFRYSSSWAVPQLCASPIELHNTNPSSVGDQIAQAIYGSLTSVTASQREPRFSATQNA